MKVIKCRLKATGGAMLQNGIVYPKVVSAGRIDATSLVDMMVRNGNMSRSQVLAVLSSLAGVIEDMVLQGHSVEVPWLGVFEPKIKGKVETARNGKPAITDPHGSVAFKAKKSITDKFKEVNYRLVSPAVHTNTTLTTEQATITVGKLAEQNGGIFSVHDFANAAGASHSYAGKVLRLLEEQGKLICINMGRMFVYKPTEGTLSPPDFEYATDNPTTYF